MSRLSFWELSLLWGWVLSPMLGQKFWGSAGGCYLLRVYSPWQSGRRLPSGDSGCDRAWCASKPAPPPPSLSPAHLDLFLQVVTQQDVGVNEVVRGIQRHRVQGPATDIASEGSLACSLWEHQPSDGGHKALGRQGNPDNYGTGCRSSVLIQTT